MRIRASGLCITLCIAAGGFGLVFLLGTLAPAAAGPRVGIGLVGLLLVGIAIRFTQVGLQLDAQRMTVRDLTATTVLDRADVAGLALQRIARGRFRRLALVCFDGRIVPAPWTVAGRDDVTSMAEAVRAAMGFSDTQVRVADLAQEQGRLIRVEQLPVVSPDAGLTPETVGRVVPDSASRGLRLETIIVIAAFALPGVADAIVILARHVGGVSDLNEFSLPLPKHQAASLVLLVMQYLTTALVVPIALLLLTRSGQPPRCLGLWQGGRWKDAIGGVALLIGVWSVQIVLLLPLTHVLNNKHLTNTASNSHVPAYYVIYALAVSLTTAINEEVLVNGYFLTRLSQLGVNPRAALAISLAVRTSYHVYYGVGLIATIPFGYLVTRSFQKRQRLARPILAHFLNDAILLTVAVLTS